MRKLALLLFVWILLGEGLLQLADRTPAVHALLMPPWERRAPILRGQGNPYHPGHDATGYRNAERPTQSEVVILGDSHAYGTGVARDSAWPALLGAYNMGLPSYGAVQSLHQLPDALTLNPRLVIVATYLGNDFADAYLAHAETADRQTLEAEVNTLFQIGGTDSQGVPAWRRWVSAHVKLYALARTVKHRLSPAPVPRMLSRDYDTALASLSEEQRQYVLPVDSLGWRTLLTPAYRAKVLDDHDPRVQQGLAYTIEAVRQIHTQTQAKGIALLVLILPTKESVFWPRGDSAVVQRETRLREAYTNALHAAGIASLDLLPALRQSLAQPYFEDVDGHPNEAGHRVIAEAVAHAIQGM